MIYFPLYVNDDVIFYSFFFFFKQKTAYEIMPSLVGSEMCIRDASPCDSSLFRQIPAPSRPTPPRLRTTTPGPSKCPHCWPVKPVAPGTEEVRTGSLPGSGNLAVAGPLRGRPHLHGEDHVPLGRERARPKGPAGGEGQVVPIRAGNQDRAVVRAHDLAAGDPVPVEAVAGLDVYLVPFDELREVDPVDVVRRHADRARIARPHARRVMARARIQNPTVDPLLDGGHVAELRNSNCEVDAVDRFLEARVDDLRAGGPWVDLAVPDLIEVLLLGGALPRPVREAAQQEESDHEADRPKNLER